jgi:hypothetical protein
MAWINGPECEAFCLALDTDYRAIREKAAAPVPAFPGEGRGAQEKGYREAPETSGAHVEGAITVLPWIRGPAYRF